ncbi:MAG: transposase [Oscillospiraceae bacterium]|nr:transposase [Oscillospiraceae bacterium]
MRKSAVYEKFAKRERQNPYKGRNSEEQISWQPEERGNQNIAPLQYECSMNGMLFESWFEQNLIPELSENSVIVMDNASFHRKKRLHAIAEAHHMTLIFLPLYSPELNPIEKEWANLKRWLKYNLRQFDTLDNAISYYFKVE